MLTVFVISSDKRVASLIEYFQPFLKTKIRCASDFDNGLKEVFENRPTVVLIQSTIGSVSGETISRHIKSLLGSASPRVVFMGDIDGSSKKDTSWCDDWICVSDSEQQMQRNFADLISRNFPEDWYEISQEMEKIVSSSAGAIEGLTCMGKEISTEGISRQAEPTGSELEINGESPNFSRPVDAAVYAGADLLGRQGKSAEEEAFLTSQKLCGELSLEKIASKSKRVFAGKLFFGLFLLVTAGSGIYFWLAREAGKTVPAVLPSASSPESVGPATSPLAKIKKSNTELPAFVRSEWQDAQYSLQHPGWERYLSPEADFRIYRKNGKIKALQGISLVRSGFSDVNFTQILNQAGIEGLLPRGKDSSENGFLVKTFILPGIAELVTYQEQGGAQIKAFVLEFS